MNKRDFIVKLLLTLKDDWPIAQWLITLVEEDVFDNEAIDALVHIFSESMKTIVDKDKREKVQKWIDVLERLKTMEEKEREVEKGELEDLEHMLDEM